MSTGQIRWGILATGGIARAFTGDLLAHGHRVEAVGSRSLAAAESFAKPFEIPRFYGSNEHLVADPAVDVIYIATPHNWHCCIKRSPQDVAARSPIHRARASPHAALVRPLAACTRLEESLASRCTGNLPAEPRRDGLMQQCHVSSLVDPVDGLHNVGRTAS